jgi:hypothetical protein
MILTGLCSQLLTAAPVTALLTSPGQTAKNSIFMNVATKQPPTSFLVLNIVAAPPAQATLDGISKLIEGEIQFDSYSSTPQAARLLSQTVRDYLMTTFNAGALPDGTAVQFVEVTLDHDEPYEQGGAGYLYRSLLRLKAFYTENAA